MATAGHVVAQVASEPPQHDPLVLVFDLDGTLFDTDPGINYDDPVSVLANSRPHALACELVRRFAKKGHVVAYLTGRSFPVRGATEQQLIDADLPKGELHTQPRWTGWVGMRAYKTAKLRALRATLYVGDHEEDRNAAEAANVPFLHADDFRAGNFYVPKEAQR